MTGNNFSVPLLIVSIPGIIIPPATLVYMGVPPRVIRPFFSTLMRVASTKAKISRRKIGLIKLFNACMHDNMHITHRYLKNTLFIFANKF